MQRIANPFTLYLDQHGALLDAGQIFVGQANADPEVTPITVYWDTALTIVAPQPIRTRGGVAVNNGSPALFYTGETDYSLRVRDADGNEVFYVKSAADSGGVAFQPLDSDLTAIAALATTAFGRSLLTAADAAGLRGLAGIVASLPLTGGTMTANILRSSAGPHIYHTDGTFVSGRVFFTPSGAADPTSQVGDQWWQYSP